MIAHHVVNFGQLLVVDLVRVREAEFFEARQKRIVFEVGIFKQRVDRVEAESRDAAFVPEAHAIQHRLAHFGIAPVQVGLLRIEIVVVILAGCWSERPASIRQMSKSSCWAACPVFAVAPDVPVAFRIVFDDRDSRNHLCWSEV